MSLRMFQKGEEKQSGSQTTTTKKTGTDFTQKNMPRCSKPNACINTTLRLRLVFKGWGTLDLPRRGALSEAMDVEYADASAQLIEIKVKHR